MQKVLTAAQMREVDRLTTERYGIPSIILMENAAHATARVITEKLGGSVKGKSILILCGKGNNGGDGAALARLLGAKGAFVDVVLFGKISETKGDARTNFSIYCRGRTEFDENDWSSTEFGDLREINSREDWDSYFKTTNQDWNVVVDALFGTGLTRPVEGWTEEVLHDINFLNDTQISYFNYDRIRVSIDIPSGLNADSGDLIGENFWSDFTVTFTAPKLANILPPASRYSKELFIADIGSPMDLVDSQSSNTYVSESEDVALWLDESEFSNDSYKNKRGHALLIAGSEDYSGAAVLAGNAAMRSGVGLVTLAAPASVKAEIASRLLPDVILNAIDTDTELPELLSKADAIAVGCGLDANDAGIEKLVRHVIETREVPVIVDAGALWFFNPPDGILQKPAREQGRYQDVGRIVLADARASANDADKNVRVPPLILTPHEGEFLRLLGEIENHPDGETPSPLLRKEGSVIKDRVAAVREFSQTHNVILVLKGERVLIGEPGGKVVVNPTGNSGLGKAGNGDTLTGILAGFVAQAVKMNIDIFETVVAAVYVAGMAGDVAEKKYGKRVMTASDVRECLVEVFAEFDDR